MPGVCNPLSVAYYISATNIHAHAQYLHGYITISIIGARVCVPAREMGPTGSGTRWRPRPVCASAQSARGLRLPPNHRQTTPSGTFKLLDPPLSRVG